MRDFHTFNFPREDSSPLLMEAYRVEESSLKGVAVDVVLLVAKLCLTFMSASERRGEETWKMFLYHISLSTYL